MESNSFISLQRMQVISFCYLAILTLGAFVFFSWEMSWSVFAGGVISMISFGVSHKDLTLFVESFAALPEEQKNEDAAKRGKGKYLLKFWLRIAIIGVALFLLIRSETINIFGLILGLSTIVFTITFTAVDVVRRYYFRGRR